MNPTTARAIERLKWTLAREELGVLQEMAWAEPSAEVAWPDDLPPLSEPLRIWFAALVVAPGGFASFDADLGLGRTPYPLLDAEAAAERFREQREEGRTCASWVPILDNVFADLSNHDAVWTLVHEDEGDRPVRVAEDIAGLAELLERQIAVRRASPWRCLRVEASDMPWRRVPIPGASALAGAPEGATLVFRYTRNEQRLKRGLIGAELYVKHRSSGWIHGTSFTRPEAPGAPGPEEIASALDSVRSDLYSAHPTIATDDELARLLERSVHRWGHGEPWGLYEGRLHVWEQAPLPAQIMRLSGLLRERFPEVHGALLPPATKDDLAALERELGRPLPTDIQALFSFANGQREDGVSLWNRWELLPTGEAVKAMQTMKGLRDREGRSRLYWDDGFVPFLASRSGDHVCVDVAGACGPVGAIVDFDHEDGEHRTVIHDGLTSWIECFADSIARGLWRIEDGMLSSTESWDEVQALTAIRSTGYPRRIRHATR